MKKLTLVTPLFCLAATLFLSACADQPATQQTTTTTTRQTTVTEPGPGNVQPMPMRSGGY